MSRNVTIVVIILIIVLLAAYLVWLRGQFIDTGELGLPGSSVAAPSPTPPVATPTIIIQKEATSSGEATKSGSVDKKSATSSGKSAR